MEADAIDTVLTILREVRDPRAYNTRHDLSAILFIRWPSLCGAPTRVDFADFGEANAADLAEIVDLPPGAPSHDCFSRVFRLLDPSEVGAVLQRFVREIRAGLAEPQGVDAVDGKVYAAAMSVGAFMPPVMVSLWDAQDTHLGRCVPAPSGNAVAASLRLSRR